MSTAPVYLWTPTVDAVAALLRARTKDLNGVEVGTFNANTRPTDEEAYRIIGMAVAEVAGVGAIGDRCASLASTLAALRAAMWIEVSYWPEQIPTGRSVYQALADQYTAGIADLRECVAGNVPDGNGDTLAGYRFGVLDVHGWTASPYYGAPVVPPLEDEDPPAGG